MRRTGVEVDVCLAEAATVYTPRIKVGSVSLEVQQKLGGKGRSSSASGPQEADEKTTKDLLTNNEVVGGWRGIRSDLDGCWAHGGSRYGRCAICPILGKRLAEGN